MQPNRSYQVFLNVYDVPASGNERATAIISRINKWGRELGLGGVFHGAIQIDNYEWSFGWCPHGSGVYTVEARQNPMYSFRETIPLGSTTKSKQEIKAVIHALKGEWQGASYDLLSRNCCHFCEAFTHLLGTQPIPAWVNRFASGAEATVAFTTDAVAMARSVSSSIKGHAASGLGWFRANVVGRVISRSASTTDATSPRRSQLTASSVGGALDGHLDAHSAPLSPCGSPRHVPGHRPGGPGTGHVTRSTHSCNDLGCMPKQPPYNMHQGPGQQGSGHSAAQPRASGAGTASNLTKRLQKLMADRGGAGGGSKGAGHQRSDSALSGGLPPLHHSGAGADGMGVTAGHHRGSALHGGGVAAAEIGGVDVLRSRLGAGVHDSSASCSTPNFARPAMGSYAPGEGGAGGDDVDLLLTDPTCDTLGDLSYEHLDDGRGDRAYPQGSTGPADTSSDEGEEDEPGGRRRRSSRQRSFSRQACSDFSLSDSHAHASGVAMNPGGDHTSPHDLGCSPPDRHQPSASSMITICTPDACGPLGVAVYAQREQQRQLEKCADLLGI